MAGIAELQNRLRESQVAVAQAEKAAAADPRSRAVASTLKSMSRLARENEAAYLDAAARAGLEACAYRAFPDGESRDDRPVPVSVIGAVLQELQSLFTITYDAIVNGPRQRNLPTDESRVRTTFGLGYTFTGSTGVVLTVPRMAKGLFDDPTYEEAERAVLDMLRATEPDRVREYSDRFGRAVVTSVQRLSNHHIEGMVGMEVEWRRGLEVTASGLYQRNDLVALQEAMGQVSDERVTQLSVTGELVAADTRKETFVMQLPDDGPLIRGPYVSGVINETRTATLPHTYHATIVHRSVVNYATGRSDDNYQLLALADPSAVPTPKDSALLTA